MTVMVLQSDGDGVTEGPQETAWQEVLCARNFTLSHCWSSL
jgi:hypothetical protein